DRGDDRDERSPNDRMISGQARGLDAAAPPEPSGNVRAGSAATGIGQRMQEVEGPGDVEPLPHPAWTGRTRVEPEPLRLVARLQSLDRLDGKVGRQRDIR